MEPMVGLVSTWLYWHSSSRVTSSILANKLDINKVIVLVHTNEISKEQTELQKSGFVQLLYSLKRTVKNTPILSRGSGIERFSRLLSLHTWFLGACAAHSVSFVDYFNLFWEWRQLFRGNGIYSNWLEVKLLSANILFTATHPGAPLTGIENSLKTSSSLLKSHQFYLQSSVNCT